LGERRLLQCGMGVRLSSRERSLGFATNIDNYGHQEMVAFFKHCGLPRARWLTGGVEHIFGEKNWFRLILFSVVDRQYVL
jgi:hypothetical protein